MNYDSDLKQQIDALNAGAMAAFGRGDADALAAGFTEDGRFLGPNAPIASGRAAVAAAWKQMRALPNVTAEWSATHVEGALSGDLAYEVGTYKLAFDADGRRIEDRGKYVVVWKRVGGTWKIAADIINSDLPAAG